MFWLFLLCHIHALLLVNKKNIYLLFLFYFFFDFFFIFFALFFYFFFLGFFFFFFFWIFFFEDKEIIFWCHKYKSESRCEYLPLFDLWIKIFSSFFLYKYFFAPFSALIKRWRGFLITFDHENIYYFWRMWGSDYIS